MNEDIPIGGETKPPNSRTKICSHCGKGIEFRNLVHEALKSSEFTVCPGVHGAPTLENVLKNVYFETGGLLSRYLCTSKFFAS